MAVDRTAPTSEIGRVASGGIAPWSSFYVDPTEYVTELMWPLSTLVYDRMLADAKVSGLVRSVELSLQNRKWAIEPNGADEASVLRLADDLALPVVGAVDTEEGEIIHRRQRNRFNWGQHLRVALKALSYGYYPFEIVGDIDMDGSTLRWILKKLAPRPPRTISEINLDEDGGLKDVKQNVSGGPTAIAPTIPVERLLWYVWDYEAGNWAGRALLRPLYRNWLIKDRLLRVDAIKHERTGVGIPVVEAPPGSSADDVRQLGEMMREMKVTEAGGGAVPSGAKPMLMGTSGSIPDTVASIRFHNEEMNAAFLAEFKSLGQGQAGGSYALGKVDYDHYGESLDAIECWILDTFNPYFVEDWYDWNYGPDSQPARIVVDEEEVPDPAPMLAGIEQSNEDAEDELEQAVAPEEAQAKLDRRNRARRRSGRAAAEGTESPSLPLPARPLRRQPYAHEVQAQTDFAQMDAQLNAGSTKLAGELKFLQQAQISELRDQIISASGDLSKLDSLAPTPNSSDAILSAMQDSASMGVDSATSEAVRQGKQAPKKPDLDAINKSLITRAEAVSQHLATALGQSAQRQMIRLSGGGLSATEVADQTAGFLRNLSTAYLEAQSNGALTSAMNTGRLATMRRNTPKACYSSELLDEATCEECVAIDGTPYETIDAASEDYPTGGFAGCLGMERCRGTVVAVYEETP